MEIRPEKDRDAFAATTMPTSRERPPPSKENTKGFDHLVSKIQRVLTSGKENTKDFDPSDADRADPDPKIKVRGDDFDATVLQG